MYYRRTTCVMNIRTRKEPTFVYDKCGFFSGGDGKPQTFNTISRELLNNAYNPRLSHVSEESKDLMKTIVFDL